MIDGRIYLCDHHMAVKGALAMGGSGAVNVGANLGDDGSAEGHVWHEMAIHDVDLEAVSGMVGRVW